MEILCGNGELIRWCGLFLVLLVMGLRSQGFTNGLGVFVLCAAIAWGANGLLGFRYVGEGFTLFVIAGYVLEKGMYPRWFQLGFFIALLGLIVYAVLMWFDFIAL